MDLEQHGDNLGGNGGGGIQWSSAMSSFVLTYLTNLVASGTKTSSGFKQVHLNGCAKALNENLGVQISGQQVGNHLRKWKKIYGKIEKMKNLSGALWDENTYTISLEPEHYYGHIKTHREDEKYLNTPLEYYHEMATIFGNSMATGAYAKGANDPLATEVTATQNAPTATTTEYDTPTNEQVGTDEGAVSGNNVGESSGIKPPPAKKPKIAADDDLVVLICQSLGQIAKSIDKAATSDNEIPEGLYNAMMSIPGFAEAHLDHYYAHLCEHPSRARAFYNLPLSSKMMWVARYIKKHLSELDELDD